MDGQKKLLVAGALFVVLLGGAIWVVNQREESDAGGGDEVAAPEFPEIASDAITAPCTRHATMADASRVAAALRAPWHERFVTLRLYGRSKDAAMAHRVVTVARSSAPSGSLSDMVIWPGAGSSRASRVVCPRAVEMDA